MKKAIFPLFLFFVLTAATCSKSTDSSDNSSTDPVPNAALETLFNRYKNGEISKCTWQGKKVYSAGLNAPDAGNEIFSEAGEKIGECYYSTGQVHEACENLEGCETIWRVKGNIWGKPAVDLIGVGE